jgi:MFS_1 like family
MALVEPLHGLTFALLHLACMQMLSVVVSPALAATAQAIYGGVAVGTMTAIVTLVSGPLYGALGPRAFLGHGATLRRCIADRVCDAQDLDQSIGVEFDPVGTSVVSCCGQETLFTQWPFEPQRSPTV